MSEADHFGLDLFVLVLFVVVTRVIDIYSIEVQRIPHVDWSCVSETDLLVFGPHVSSGFPTTWKKKEV